MTPLFLTKITPSFWPSPTSKYEIFQGPTFAPTPLFMRTVFVSPPSPPPFLIKSCFMKHIVRYHEIIVFHQDLTATGSSNKKALVSFISPHNWNFM